MLGLTLAIYTPTRCVNPCRPVFIRVGISVQRRVDLRRDRTWPAAFKLCSCLVFNEQDQNVKLISSLQQANRRKLTALVLMGFIFIATLSLKPWVSFTTSVPVKKYVPLSVKGIFNVVAGKEILMLSDYTIYRRKVSMFSKCGIAKCRDCTKQPTTNTVKQHIWEHFPYRRSVAVEQLVEEIKRGKSFAYVKCDIEVPEKFRPKFDNFPAIFKNTLVSENDIGDLMTTMPRKKDYCLNLENCWYPASHHKMEHLLLRCYCFLYNLALYAPKFTVLLSNFQRNASTALCIQPRRQGDDNSKSNVVAETMTFLTNISYGYQIIDRSRHTVMRYLSDKRTQAAVNKKLLKKLDHLNNTFYEVELSRAQI